MNFEKILIEDLVKYWEGNNNTFSTFEVEINEKEIKLKRTDNGGVVCILGTLCSNEELKKYVERLKMMDEINNLII